MLDYELKQHLKPHNFLRSEPRLNEKFVALTERVRKDLEDNLIDEEFIKTLKYRGYWLDTSNASYYYCLKDHHKLKLPMGDSASMIAFLIYLNFIPDYREEREEKIS